MPRNKSGEVQVKKRASFFLHVHVFALAVFAAALTGCGGGGDPAVDPSDAAPVALASEVSLTGKFFAPDGTTPIANALVYAMGNAASMNAVILKQMAGSNQMAVLSCGEAPAEALAATCTNPNGSFELKVPGATTTTLVVLKGAFKVEKPVSFASGQTTASVGDISIPTTGSNAIKMAVVTGEYDSIEDVLAKLGFGQLENGRLKLGTEKFTLYNGEPYSSMLGGQNYLDVNALFNDSDKNGKADIFDYSIVFFNCGLDDQLITLDPVKVATLKAYVEAGGRIYASDWAYNLVEQAFPAYIDFMGSDNTLASEPEFDSVAKLGMGDIFSNAEVDGVLKSWLQAVTCQDGPCVQADGKVKIEGFIGGWVVMNGGHAGASVKTWVSGPVTFEDSLDAANTVTANKPLTMSFQAGLGRVTFTSYHNEASIGDAMLPQQRILQYLVFEL